MLPWAWLDGRFVRADAAAAPLSAPALLRGEGVFETMACEGGAPLLFDYHHERLAGSAAALGLRLRLRPRALAEAVARTLARNGTRDATARLMLLRGARRDAVAIACRRLERPSPADCTRGVTLAAAPWRRAEGVPIHRHKTLAYWECQEARAWARARGAFDALFLTPAGHVLEGSMTNVFCVRRGTLTTPPVSMGLLPGVMRRFVLTASRALFGVTVREARLTVDDLLRGDEVFVTNAVIGAVPVREIAGRAAGRGRGAAMAFRAAYDVAVRGGGRRT